MGLETTNKETTHTILLAMGYNLNPSVIHAVIEAYELAKDKGNETSIDDIVQLKNDLGK